MAKLLRWASIMTKVAFCVSTGQLNNFFPLLQSFSVLQMNLLVLSLARGSMTHSVVGLVKRISGLAEATFPSQAKPSQFHFTVYIYSFVLNYQKDDTFVMVKYVFTSFPVVDVDATCFRF